MPGFLGPYVRQQGFDAGLVAPGAKLYTYLSGTSTPQPTYSDPDLDPSHAHPNPLVADSTGLFPAYWLDNVAYRMTLTDSTDATIWGPTDGISSASVSVGGSNGQVQFNDAGTFGGDAGLTYNKTTDALSVGGALSAGGAVTAASVSTTGAVTAGTTMGVGTNLAVAGNATVTGTLGVTGLSTLGIVTSSTQPRCRAFNSASQTVNGGTSAALTLDSTGYNVGMTHSNSVNSERVEVVTAGFYLAIGFTTVAATGGSPVTANVALRVTGTGQIETTQQVVTATFTMPVCIVGAFAMSPGDYFDLYASSVSNNVAYGSATQSRATQLVAIKLW